jgi:glycosyltransferase involved in cell wall biosynthesis
MNSHPMISIIIPAYNAATTLPRTFQSLDRIETQHRAHVEIVVVNDGSTDGSKELIESARQVQTGFRWQVIHQQNGGLSAARNAAIQAATGDWICFLDADDELATDLVLLASQHPDATSIGCSLEYRTSGRQRSRRVRPRSVSPANWLDVLTAENPFQPSSLLFRRACLDTLFDPGIEIVNDWLFWLSNPRLFERMQTRTDVTSAVIHIHDRNMSSAYAKLGRNRTAVADRISSQYGSVLTPRQQNQLWIQESIGRLQSDRQWTPSAFLCLPCSPLLYVKLLVYAGASLLGLRATPYRSASEDGIVQVRECSSP